MTSLNDILTYIVTGLLAGVALLVRMVFTNHKQIEMLKQEIEYRNSVLEELRAEQKELRRELHECFMHISAK